MCEPDAAYHPPSAHRYQRSIGFGISDNAAFPLVQRLRLLAPGLLAECKRKALAGDRLGPTVAKSDLRRQKGQEEASRRIFQNFKEARDIACTYIANMLVNYPSFTIDDKGFGNT